MRGIVAFALTQIQNQDLLAEDFGDLGDAMTQAMEAEAEEQAKALTAALREGLKSERQVREYRLAQIRRYKGQIKVCKNVLDNITRARQYGAETQNYVPWLVALGTSYYSFDSMCTREEWERLSTIPKNWKPSEE